VIAGHTSERHVENGVSRIEADHETDTVELVAEDDIADHEVKAAIENAGYDVAT
jgi:copper chaperone